jgi:hypothetical protein
MQSEVPCNFWLAEVDRRAAVPLTKCHAFGVSVANSRGFIEEPRDSFALPRLHCNPQPDGCGLFRFSVGFPPSVSMQDKKAMMALTRRP